MNGLIFPIAGTITAFGEPITEQALRDENLSNRFRRRVGFIFQNSDSQLFSPTVRDEIAFGPLQMDLPIEEVEQRIEDIAQMLEISRLLDRAPFQLSGGEKKKVAIAASLAVGPDVLLLDEPTTGLDPRSQHWLVELLSKLHAVGKTLITATHDLNIVPHIADRAIVFSEEHRIMAADDVKSVLSDSNLLVSVNLIQPHWHRHGTVWHDHPHEPDRPHIHPDE
jgi:cobalt/nickel transport system ATP-binding protein